MHKRTLHRLLTAAAAAALLLTTAATPVLASSQPTYSSGYRTIYTLTDSLRPVLDNNYLTGLLNRLYGQLGWQPVQPQPPAPPQQPAQPQPQPPAQPPKQPAQPQPPAQQPKQPAQQTASASLTAEERQMLDLVNGERAKAGLAPLQADPLLTKLARMKSQDMITNHYFSHTSPVWGSPFDLMRNNGVQYRTAGENIAGNQSVSAAHVSLMNSPGHRANILNGQFTRVGIGIVHGGAYGIMFTQDFTG